MNPALVETDQDWAVREAYWRTKLRRLRFHAEPIAVQVERYRRVTIALTVVASVVAVMFLAVFAAFHRPDIALMIVGLLFAPIVGLAWFDFKRLTTRASAYLEEARTAGRIE